MLTVATHSGTFHADDAFAYAILKAATAGALELARTRDAARLAEADVVFDVGGSFDPANHRYDHHMRDKPLRPNGEPYSSAGLVWREFGAAAIATLVPGASPEAVARVWSQVDGGLIRDVDLMDNGAMSPAAGHFSTLLEAFNPTFAEESGAEESGDETAAFFEAAELAGRVLARACARAFAAFLAEDRVAEAARLAPDPRVLVLETRVPWEDAVFDLGLTQALYVVRPAGEQWTCSAVPPERGSFDQRRPLPDAWGGLRDAAFVAQSGVADATFCHPARFVCGARSRDGAVELARRACR